VAREALHGGDIRARVEQTSYEPAGEQPKIGDLVTSASYLEEAMKLTLGLAERRGRRPARSAAAGRTTRDEVSG
jgi:hypothetical protein